MLTNSRHIFIYVIIRLLFGITHSFGDGDTVCVKDSSFARARKVFINSHTYRHFVLENYIFADKTLFIKEFLSNGTINGSISVNENFTILYCPRKSGKSMSLAMLFFFLQPEVKNGIIIERTESMTYNFFATGFILEKNKLQKPPEISKEKYIMENYLGKCPTIFISFLELDYRNIGTLMNSLQIINRMGFLQHIYLVDYMKKIINNATSSAKEKLLAQQDFDAYNYYVDRKVTNDTNILAGICRLAETLERIFNRKAILLIDDFDSTFLTNYKHHDIEYTINFRKIKKNAGILEKYLRSAVRCPSIQRTLAVGVSDFGRFQIKDAVNISRSFTILNNPFSKYYSLSENEVRQILRATGTEIEENSVRLWYQGYYFGSQRSLSYNIYSIVNFVNNRKIQSYWLEKHPLANLYKWLPNRNIRHMFLNLLTNHRLPVRNSLSLSYDEGEFISRIFLPTLKLDSGLKDLEIGEEQLLALRIFLLNCGYLTFNESVADKPNQDQYYTKLPNNEIRTEVLNHFHCYQSLICGRKTNVKTFKTTTEEVSCHLKQLLRQNETYEKLEKGISSLFGYFAPFSIKNAADLGDFDGSRSAIIDLLYASIIVSAAYLKVQYFDEEYTIQTAYIGSEDGEPDVLIYGHGYAVAIGIRYGKAVPKKGEEIDKLFFSIPGKKAIPKNYTLFFDSMPVVFKTIKALGVFVVPRGTCHFHYKFIRT